MKKTISLLICSVIIFSCFSIIVQANEITPYTNNVQHTETIFVIDDAGKATAKVSYVGISGITTGATINIKLQKRFLFVFWNDVASWTDESSNYYYSNSHSTTVSSGTYRVQVEYTIRGTGGEPDVITEELERSH